MKTSKKLIGLFFLALLFTMGNLNAYASDGTPNERIGVKIKSVNDNQTVRVHLYNLLELPTKIRVKSSTGEVIYRENVKNEVGLVKGFNFSRLPQGDYTITIEQEGIKVTQHLSTKSYDVVMGGKETWKFESPSDNSLAVSKIE